MGTIASQITSRDLLNRLFGRRSQKTSKLRVTGLCVGKSPRTGEIPAQMASNAENISIWWRHHDVRGVRLCRNLWVSGLILPYFCQYLSTDTGWMV